MAHHNYNRVLGGAAQPSLQEKGDGTIATVVVAAERVSRVVSERPVTSFVAPKLEIFPMHALEKIFFPK
jgi:hypothetical protein